MGLFPLFSLPTFFKNIDKFVVNKKKQVAQGLAYYGEQFVNDAREGGSYQDQTSNLRGSIAYDVFVDGESFADNYKSFGSDVGVDNARITISEVADSEGYNDKDKITLVGVAGMEYAAAVESKGYDVITPFIPKESDINELLGEAGLLRRKL